MEKTNIHQLESTTERLNNAINKIGQVILGKNDQIRLALTCLLAGGHCLIEDQPGVGKTTLAHTMAQVMGLDFHRIQFTSDLLPADVLGVSVFNRELSQFEFHPGPIFSHFILADEINRTPPKTQAALLEAMQEKQVSIGNTKYELEKPFFVLATQNPIEQEGTYPLPEAQLDRFLVQLTMDYPDAASELEILYHQPDCHDDDIEQVVTVEDFAQLQRIVQSIQVEKSVGEYMVRISAATREHQAIRLGCSPRGTQMLFRASQAAALIAGRSFVLPDDVQHLAAPLLAHRLVFRDARTSTPGKRAVVEELLRSIEVPV
jgi:MoxR-like ATPase